MSAKIYLAEAKDVDSAVDSVIHLNGPPPLISGNDDENLACFSCKVVLARGVSTRSMYERFAAPNRLIVKCECGAFNSLPSQKEGVPIR